MQLATAALLASALSFGQVPEANKVLPATQAVKLDNCIVSPLQDVDVPASEAGVLTDIFVKEGQNVMGPEETADGSITPSTPLAQIEDRDAILRKAVAEAEYEGKVKEAENDVNIRYAQKSAEVAQAELDDSLAINRRSPNTIPPTEIRRQQLTAERGLLQKEVAEHEQSLAAIAAKSAKAQVDAVENEIDRRSVDAMLSGRVEKIYRNKGEWVNPGDPVMRIVRMDRLKVEGFVNASLYLPQDVDKRPVRIDIRLPGNRVETFSGHVASFSPLVEASGEFRIWAEVENRRELNYWLMRPGMSADMYIYTNQDRVEERELAFK